MAADAATRDIIPQTEPAGLARRNVTRLAFLMGVQVHLMKIVCRGAVRIQALKIAGSGGLNQQSREDQQHQDGEPEFHRSVSIRPMTGFAGGDAE